MNWNEVYTRKQKECLITSSVLALRNFVEWVWGLEIQEEILLTSPNYHDVLVIDKNRQLMERIFNIGSETYKYEAIAGNSYEQLVEKYKLTPSTITESRRLIEKKMRDNTNEAKEKSAAIEELERIEASPAVKDLLRTIVIAGQEEGEQLALNADVGLHERGLKKCRRHPLGSLPIFGQDFERVIIKYGLTSKSLANLREKIERT